jgi:hypothetical protein
VAEGLAGVETEGAAVAEGLVGGGGATEGLGGATEGLGGVTGGLGGGGGLVTGVLGVCE